MSGLQFELTASGKTMLAELLGRKEELSRDYFDIILSDFSSRAKGDDFSINSEFDSEGEIAEFLDSRSSYFRSKIYEALSHRISKIFPYSPDFNRDAKWGTFKGELASYVSSKIAELNNNLERLARQRGQARAVSAGMAEKICVEVSGGEDAAAEGIWTANTQAAPVQTEGHECWAERLERSILGLESVKKVIYSEAEAELDEAPEQVSHKLLSTMLVADFSDFVEEDECLLIGGGLEDFLLSEGIVTKGESKFGSERFYINQEKLSSFELAEFEAAGLDMKPVFEGRTYVIGSESGGTVLYPSQLRQRCLDDYVDFVGSLAVGDKEAGKIDFIRGVLNADAGFPVGDYVRFLYKDVRKKLKALTGDLEQGTTIEEILGGRVKLDGLKEIAMEELATLANAKLQSKGKKNKIKTMERFMKRFDEKEYETRFGWRSRYEDYFCYQLFYPLAGNAARFVGSTFDFGLDFADSVKATFGGLKKVLGSIINLPARYLSLRKGGEAKRFPWEDKSSPVYEISITHNPHELKSAAVATDSACIKDGSIVYFSDIVSDKGTISLVGKVNGVEKGYARIFITEDMTQEAPVLFVDTIEPPLKEFKNYKGLVNAFSLAAIQLGMEMGASCVVGTDARVGHGPRQGYSSVKNSLFLKKLGRREPIKTYQIKFDNSGKSDWLGCYVLAENWRASKDD